ncbi:hypothetical protein Golob_013013 [Gossypium lobatum]|uniref:Uncharacterized protein n=1 Tax=Gossypium lobatum TaxID=34289 RepID=A0A7J8LNA1_9ROSI|nr:hypothetical protein [Gossypium lobatum]
MIKEESKKDKNGVKFYECQGYGHIQSKCAHI